MKFTIFMVIAAAMFNSNPTYSKELNKVHVSPLMYELKQTTDDFLFPQGKPISEGYLKVSELHQIWYQQYGNPSGVPILFVHGGPGGGSDPRDMRYFDPSFYRIILFDQRGAMRSKPLAEMKENTTQNLIEDMEKLRKSLQIEKWVLFGGSWGSALSMLYGEAHPQQCLGFILRGIFLGTDDEVNQLWYGMRDTYPEAWDEMVHFLPPDERTDLIGAFNKRLKNPDSDVNMPAARAFVKYDLLASFSLKAPPVETILKDDRLVLGLGRSFVHYCMNHFFIEKNQILNELGKITHLPALLVHGRFDTILRAKSAYTLFKAWPGSELTLVPDAGHAASEPGNTKALIDATQKMKTLIGVKGSN